ncbi:MULTISPECIES: hypothetical protein [Methylobacterium]|uniref:hypothetical protein n=1 Tax=Methylobacterium TaxID=407 RepID=UPI001FED5A3A|nr:hypothetical protein [Methylobacterium sp. DB0501]
MTGSADGLGALIRLLAKDAALAARLRPIEDPAALVRAAVAEAAARGLTVDAAALERLMDDNRAGFLMHPTPMIPLARHEVAP